MHLVDLALGDRHDRNTGKAQALVESGNVLLVAGKPVQRLGQHHVEPAPAGVLHQCLNAGTEHRRTRDRSVRVALHYRPALALSPRPADPQLVLHRRITLQVSGIPRIQGYSHSHHTTPKLIVE